MSYRVKLQNFEGPLDLLLFLIKKNEVDIYDIPIADITRQYLQYMEIIKILDLESAGDFLILASTLIRIKVQLLLPRPQLEDDDDEMIDPRLELVTKLLEYKQFKEVAHRLGDLESTQLVVYPRSYFNIDDSDGEEDDIVSGEVSLFALIHAFKQVVENMPQVIVHEIKDIEVSTKEQSEYILNILTDKIQISFIELLSRLTDKIIMIVTFLALLDLIRQQLVIVKQAKPFGEIWIQKT